jgi:eukaryotic-like serine/threonine-protein kinase
VSPPSAIAGRYRIERRLGAGGMSTVFEATDAVLERPVAVKLLAEHLAEDADFVARFRREALSAARLQHPNVVQVFDSGRDPDSDRHYIVMEYVDGPSCADLLREHKMLDIEWTVHILRDACHGLDYAHRAGVVHRDVKPGNLLVARETNATKLADFGIAKAAEQTRITQVGAVLGTAAYLSPEQARGEEAGPASDIYSLGVCAYQFLTGRLPHEYGSLTELALKQQQDAVRPITELRPEVGPELDEAVRLCLERDPGRRYGSALDLGHALEAGLRGESTEATRRMSLDDTDATSALAATDITSSTRAMPRTSYAAPSPPSPRASAQTTAPPERRDARDAARAARRRQMASLFALLLVLAAVGAVAIALLASSAGNTDVRAPDANDVEQQIDELRDFIRENSR